MRNAKHFPTENVRLLAWWKMQSTIYDNYTRQVGPPPKVKKNDRAIDFSFLTKSQLTIAVPEPQTH